MTHISRVRLATNEYLSRDGTARQVNQIEVHIMDMWLRKDITCARDEHLAQQLAEASGVELEDCIGGGV